MVLWVPPVDRIFSPGMASISSGIKKSSPFLSETLIRACRTGTRLSMVETVLMLISLSHRLPVASFFFGLLDKRLVKRRQRVQHIREVLLNEFRQHKGGRMNLRGIITGLDARGTDPVGIEIG